MCTLFRAKIEVLFERIKVVSSYKEVQKGHLGVND